MTHRLPASSTFWPMLGSLPQERRFIAPHVMPLVVFPSGTSAEWAASYVAPNEWGGNKTNSTTAGELFMKSAPAVGDDLCVTVIAALLMKSAPSVGDDLCVTVIAVPGNGRFS
ncbi:hypothetical protein EMWEY_00057000 [Eimeria maxima]|uniref:Uncharacterized protein n=1 Tax=Eimeria maxima TaxID=5804 RepID=U6MA28_EIMMA|nr:hypothetical protein EMWEY_00057000 [Eimeria maxima]CDJ59349.1 hypothetical protein EMWEY_00057000 [Eimeria maxima]